MWCVGRGENGEIRKEKGEIKPGAGEVSYGQRVMSNEWGLFLVQRYGTKMAHSEIERDRAR